jgi:hypothetical protein
MKANVHSEGDRTNEDTCAKPFFAFHVDLARARPRTGIRPQHRPQKKIKATNSCRSDRSRPSSSARA